MGEIDNSSIPDAIPNAELRAADVPASTSDWNEIWNFALTVNGYQHFPGHKFAFANDVGRKYKEGAIDLSGLSLSELRGCLFFEQRRYRWLGQDPTAEVMDYIHALLGAIRAKIK